MNRKGAEIRRKKNMESWKNGNMGVAGGEGRKKIHTTTEDTENTEKFYAYTIHSPDSSKYCN